MTSQLKLWCLITGDPNPFLVSVSPNNYVAGLKKAIYEERKNGILSGADPPTLVLWKLNEPERVNPEDSLPSRIQSKGILSEFAVKLRESTESLSELFISTPPDKHLHILVCFPSSGLKRDRSLNDDREEDAKRRMQGMRIVDEISERTCELALAIAVIGSPHSELVRKVYQMMNDMRVIQICGTPATGKTSLSYLLFRYITETAPSPKRVYLGTGWVTKNNAELGDQTAWQGRLQKIVPGWSGSADGAMQYLLLDEAQTTYWDGKFWNDFIKAAQAYTSRCRIVLFCAYGSSTLSDQSFSTPPVITNAGRVSLLPPNQAQNEQPTLLLTRSEYLEVLRNQPDPLDLDEDLTSAIYNWTSGHIGAVLAVLSCISKPVKACMARQEVYTLEQFARDWPSFRKFALGLADQPAMRRSLPFKPAIQTYATTFRQLIQEVHVETPLDDFDSESKLCYCYSKGWVTEVDTDLSKRYFFPSPLHRAYISWFLLPCHVVPLPEDYQIYNLAADVIQEFTTSQLLPSARNVGGGPQDSAPEALYQNEFYRGILKKFNGGVGITPEFSSALGARVAGRIDFFIHQTKWGIECMRDGDRLQAHSDRFADNNAYGQWLQDGDMEDYILLDFRVRMPKQPHPGIKNLYHVVFSADGTHVDVYDNLLNKKIISKNNANIPFAM